MCGALIYLIYVINIPKPYPLNFWFQHFHLTHFMRPFLLLDFDWFLQMKCQHVTDQTNFPMLLLLSGKLGRNSPDKKNVFLCRGEAIHQNAVILLPDRKQTLMLLSVCTAFHFTKEFVNYLDSLSLSVHVGLDSWSWLLWARNLLFFVRNIWAISNCAKVFQIQPKENEMHPVSPLILFEMMNTSGALNYNKSNSLMQHCGGEEEAGYSS